MDNDRLIEALHVTLRPAPFPATLVLAVALSAEADLDWTTVVHQGGPGRGLDRHMPAFGEALSPAEIALAVSHVRTFCADSSRRALTAPCGRGRCPRSAVRCPEDRFPTDCGAALTCPP